MEAPASGSGRIGHIFPLTTTMDQPPSHPYGPSTALIRRFFVRLAALGATEREAVVKRYSTESTTPKWQRAELQLGMAVSQANREDSQQALAGPLLQIVSTNDNQSGDEPKLHPIAEPALAALLALLVYDVAPALVETLYSPFADIIPFESITVK